KEHATAGISVDRHETTSPTDELRTLVLEHGLLNRIEVDVQSRSDSLGFTHVLELNRLPREHRLIDIGMLELSAHSSPLVSGLVLGLCNIDRVIHETELVVRSLVLEHIAVASAELEDLLDDLRCCVGDLDGVGLDVSYREALLLHVVLQIDHKQSTTLGDDVVDVARILEAVVELRRGQAIDDVDNNLQRIRELVCFLFVREVTCQLTAEHGLSGIEISMLDCDPG